MPIVLNYNPPSAAPIGQSLANVGQMIMQAGQVRAQLQSRYDLAMMEMFSKAYSQGYATTSQMFENKRERDWRSAEAAKDRDWRTGEADRERMWRSGESQLERDWRTGERIGEQDWRNEFEEDRLWNTMALDSHRSGLREGEAERRDARVRDANINEAMAGYLDARAGELEILPPPGERPGQELQRQYDAYRADGGTSNFTDYFKGRHAEELRRRTVLKTQSELLAQGIVANYYESENIQKGLGDYPSVALPGIAQQLSMSPQRLLDYLGKGYTIETSKHGQDLIRQTLDRTNQEFMDPAYGVTSGMMDAQSLRRQVAEATERIRLNNPELVPPHDTPIPWPKSPQDFQRTMSNLNVPEGARIKTITASKDGRHIANMAFDYPKEDKPQQTYFDMPGERMDLRFNVFKHLTTENPDTKEKIPPSMAMVNQIASSLERTVSGETGVEFNAGGGEEEGVLYSVPYLEPRSDTELMDPDALKQHVHQLWQYYTQGQSNPVGGGWQAIATLMDHYKNDPSNMKLVDRKVYEIARAWTELTPEQAKAKIKEIMEEQGQEGGGA